MWMTILLGGLLLLSPCVGFLAATRPARVSVTMAALACGAAVAIWSVGSDWLRWIPHESPLTVVALTNVIAWLIGRSVRQAHQHEERLRDQAAVQAATAERLRIARELHDMVAHSIGIIAIQAGAGSRVIGSRPDQAQRALSTIEATSRETLAGLRRMLGALRSAETGPAPALPGQSAGLADIGNIAAATSGSGVNVDVRWLGQRQPLPPDIDLSAFRIVQEAVTNVMQHAAASHCHISIDQDEDQVKIEVTDDGCGGVVSGAGYGITGMRERVSLLNGDFHAGPRPGGGFRVSARLPLPIAAR